MLCNNSWLQCVLEFLLLLVCLFVCVIENWITPRWKDNNYKHIPLWAGREATFFTPSQPVQSNISGLISWSECIYILQAWCRKLTLATVTRCFALAGKSPTTASRSRTCGMWHAPFWNRCMLGVTTCVWNFNHVGCELTSREPSCLLSGSLQPNESLLWSDSVAPFCVLCLAFLCAMLNAGFIKYSFHFRLRLSSAVWEHQGVVVNNSVEICIHRVTRN